MSIRIDVGKRCMDWVNAYYGRKHVALRNTIWEEGFKKGQINDENALSATNFEGLEKQSRLIIGRASPAYLISYLHSLREKYSVNGRSC